VADLVGKTFDKSVMVFHFYNNVLHPKSPTRERQAVVSVGGG